jgi:hypothetical protein
MGEQSTLAGPGDLSEDDSVTKFWQFGQEVAYGSEILPPAVFHQDLIYLKNPLLI